MNALHLAQTIAEADETTFGKLIVELPHSRHAKSLLTRRLSLNPGLQVSQSGSGFVLSSESISTQPWGRASLARSPRSCN
jgi:hypothetical protein